MLLILISITPFVLWVLGATIGSVLLLPTAIEKTTQSQNWRQYPAYMQMSDATFKISPELSPSPYRWTGPSDSAFVPITENGNDKPFRVFKTLSEFNIRCHKEYNCIPNLPKDQGSVVGVRFTDKNSTLYPDNTVKRIKSFNNNFDYSPNPIEKYDSINVEFSLISKKPLYLGSHVVVLCGSGVGGLTLQTRICYFEALRAEPGYDNNSFTPRVKFQLSSGNVKSNDPKIIETNVFHPEIWPEIIKGLEKIITKSRVPTLEVKRIEEASEGHWKADRLSKDYKY